MTFLAEILLRHWEIIFRALKVDIYYSLSGIRLQKYLQKNSNQKMEKCCF